jgi:choline-sulfatase
MSQLNRREMIFSSAAAFAQGGRKRPPNVLFLMSDEHSPHAAGWMGNRDIRTPALDSLAKSGVAFDAAYCQNPICVPSRASFLTGRMPSNVGVYANGGGLHADAVTLADVFKKAGYTTAWFGKTHWGGDSRFEIQPGGNDGAKKEDGGRSRLPEDAKVTDRPVSEEGDTLAQQQTIQFLKEHRDKPFFVGTSFIKPHFPFLVQEQYYQLYRELGGIPNVTPEMLADLPKYSKAERESYGFAGLSAEQIRKARAIYFGMVTYVDELFGGILKTVDELGLRENTVILYTADHGELAGEHGLWYKNSFYEAGVRIPHIWSFPARLPKGKTISAPVMNMDIFPTLCELCGLTPPAGLEGHSLMPLIEGKENGEQRVAISENFRGGAAARMLRTSRWKYCYTHEDKEHLFDMRNDQGEIHNLAARPEHRELVASMRKRALEGWRYQEFVGRTKKKQGAGKGEK